jgi:SagB-type dehydrogenase family enzyme
VRWSAGATEIVAPRGGRSIEFEDPRVLTLLHAFARPRSLDGLDPAVLALARALVAEGVLERAQDNEVVPWSPHDAAYHVLSRLGRGGTYRFLGVSPPLPLFKRRMRALKRVKLPRPSALPSGPSLFSALEQRRSSRDFRSAPLSLEELGALLHVAARNRAVLPGEHGSELGSRAYPSGGAMYPLELYPLIPAGGCVGLDRGLYHYRPGDHTLELLGEGAELLDGLSSRWRHAAQVRGDAWILFHVTARIGRTGWKYEGIAYSLILKELGCLLQTFYLAAGALDLGACAVGGGHLDALADTIGIDPWKEPQVGEFFVGRPAPRSAPEKARAKRRLPSSSPER